MDFKLVVTDLDGTLLNADHRVGGYTRRVLSELLERGVELMLASGRHFMDVRAIARLFGGDVSIVCANGAAVYDGAGSVLDMTALAPECLDFLLHDPAFDGLHANLYRAKDWLVERPKPSLLGYHKDSGFSYRVTDFSRLSEEPVLKVFFYGEPAELRDFEAYVTERCAGAVTTTFSLPIALEVMAAGVSKGAALERFRARREIQRSEVIAFGDGPNDIELLRAAGCGVLMGNADPMLKAALPDNPSIGTNGDEAVAHYLRELLGRA